MSGVRVGGSWKIPAQTFVKVGGSWKTVATVSVKVGGAWKNTTFSGPPDTPVMSYLGSGTSNNGLFEVSNTVAGAEYVATNVSGGGSATQSVVNGKVRFQLSSVNSRWSVKARWAAGTPESGEDFMERKAAAQDYVVTIPFQCYHNASGCVNNHCGCGTYYAQANPTGGFPSMAGWWACCEGRSYYYINYAGQGYTWSGSDYTNGQGEWWKTA